MGWDMLGPKETESSEQTNMVLGRAKKSEKNGIKELELKKPQIGHEPESLPSSDLIPIGTSKDEPKMLADSPRVAAGETLQKSIPMKKDVLSLKKETITTEQWQETKQPLMVENLNKPKLKKIRQFELDEGPLEELRQHENAIPEEIENSGPAVSTLPEYDLAAKREKTKLEKHKIDEIDVKPKSKETPDDQMGVWEKLNTNMQESPSKKPSMIMGKGEKSEKSPTEETKLKVLQNVFESDEPSSMDLKASDNLKDETKLTSDSLMDTEPKPLQKQKESKKDVLTVKKETTVKVETQEKEHPLKDDKITENKPKLKKINEVLASPLEKLRQPENAKPVEMEEFNPDGDEIISSLPTYEIQPK